MNYRTGIGFDVHQLVEGRALYLGGVEIPFEKGLAGHSDADVLLHAVCDALLGAAGLGDIGEHFPNNDERYKGISSLQLLSEVFRMLVEGGYAVVNVDCVLLAEQPNIKNYKAGMKANIAGCLSLDEGAVNIKATTNEGLGYVGEKKGLAAYAVAGLIRKDGVQ